MSSFLLQELDDIITEARNVCKDLNVVGGGRPENEIILDRDSRRPSANVVVKQ